MNTALRTLRIAYRVSRNTGNVRAGIRTARSFLAHRKSTRW